ncbi:hypothetical protein C0991_009999 [Blastosporella zonata]|nr:hypothetical protein C0991_009999 [Blastosporella zonata]
MSTMIMPFSKYFADDPPPEQQQQQQQQFRGNELQFQLPAFMQQGVPTLAHGGGAEVLPFNSTWFTNNAFYPSASLCPSQSDNISFPILTAPSPLGLPVYSASGFDILSVLARVASRSNPHVHLGPVDMTCSFVVVDVRRHDAPIVYCSPTFCRLTGYPENEVLGRNCRFLQAPPGSGEVRRGEPRRFTSQTSVDTMRKALVAGKECQTSIVNFRKDGAAFINLVSIIPIGGGERGEDGEVVYHVGFQVDLTEQPNVIMEKLRNGSYVQPQSQPLTQVDPTTRPSTARQILPPPPPTVTGKSPMALQAPAPIQRKPQMPPLTMSAYLAKVLANPALLRALPITTCTTAPPLLPTSHLSSPPAHLSSSPTTSSSSSQNPATAQTNSPLSLLLLEYSPDPIFVVSLKGAFLYVSPAIQRLLGHRPQDLVGRSIADLAHPEDVVPLERQLKESSSLNPPSNPSTTATNATSTTHEVGVKQERDCDNKDIKDTKEGSHAHARLIDVLFRARTRGGRYVWVEARGRLHVEPGKGRKAIVLSARARGMPCVSWGDILPLPRLPSSSSTRLSSSGDSPRDFWAQLSGLNSSAGTIVSSSPSIRSVLGYTPDEVLARRVPALCVPEDKERVQRAITEIEKGCSGGRRERRKVLFVRMQRGAMGKEAGLGEREREKEVDVVSVRLVFYPTPRDPPELGPSGRPLGIAPPVTLLHVALVPPGFERGATVECSIDVDHEQHQQHQRQHPPQHQYHEHNTENESGSVAPWHDPSTNIFAELEVSRGSSWQYELQQLRFVNLRLREEVKRLGREVALVEGAGLGLGLGGPSNQMTTDFTGLVEMAEEDDGEVGAFAHQEEFAKPVPTTPRTVDMCG